MLLLHKYKISIITVVIANVWYLNHAVSILFFFDHVGAVKERHASWGRGNKRFYQVRSRKMFGVKKAITTHSCS